MVLADSVTVNSDLFWAIRVWWKFWYCNYLLFQAHPVTNVFGGPTLWPIEQNK
jgi:hypothetical protein